MIWHVADETRTHDCELIPTVHLFSTLRVCLLYSNSTTTSKIKTKLENVPDSTVVQVFHDSKRVLGCRRTRKS